MKIMTLLWLLSFNPFPLDATDALKDVDRHWKESGETLIYDVASSGIGYTHYGVWIGKPVVDSSLKNIERFNRGEHIGDVVVEYCVKSYKKSSGEIVVGEAIEDTRIGVLIDINLPNGSVFEWRGKRQTCE